MRTGLMVGKTDAVPDLSLDLQEDNHIYSKRKMKTTSSRGVMEFYKSEAENRISKRINTHMSLKA